jgi:hypothetical protein
VATILLTMAPPIIANNAHLLPEPPLKRASLKIVVP